MNSKIRIILISVVGAILLLAIGIGFQRTGQQKEQKTDTVQTQKEESAQGMTESDGKDDLGKNEESAVSSEADTVKRTVRDSSDPAGHAESDQSDKDRAGSSTDASNSGEAEYRDEIVTEPDAVILPGDELEGGEGGSQKPSADSAAPAKDSGASAKDSGASGKDSGASAKDSGASGKDSGASGTSKDGSQKDNGSEVNGGQNDTPEDENSEDGVELPIILFE